MSKKDWTPEQMGKAVEVAMELMKSFADIGMGKVEIPPGGAILLELHHEVTLTCPEEDCISQVRELALGHFEPLAVCLPCGHALWPGGMGTLLDSMEFAEGAKGGWDTIDSE